MPIHSNINDKSAGIYIHVPFCIKKCSYCDFYSVTDLSLIENYVNALISEAALIPPKPFVFDSIYFGGGTPSLLSPQLIAKILNALFKNFHITDSPEITLESNPKTISSDNLNAYKQTGINRIHLGVQSFFDPHLRLLNRIHSSSDAQKSLDKIRNAGFANVGIDLIYGLPEQSRKQWMDDLQTAVSFSPEHLSCYMLTYESGTPLEKLRLTGKIEPLSDEDMADLFETTVDVLSAKGYFQYEISNFARIITSSGGEKDHHTYRSRHNQKYWSFAPYLGLGPAAHSFESPMRYWNIRDVHHYMDLLNVNLLPLEDSEILTRDQQIIEAISLGLRTSEGIEIGSFEEKFELSFEKTFGPALKSLTEQGLLIISSGRLKTTLKGMLLLNSIVEMLVDLL